MFGYRHSCGRQRISWHGQTGLLSARDSAGTDYAEWVTAISVARCDLPPLWRVSVKWAGNL